MPKKYKSASYTRLRSSLISNLESRGLVEDIYLDKVAEYMDLWEHRQALKRDIDERGVLVLDEKRGGMTENRSVSLEAQVSRQMLAIYTALGFKDEAISLAKKSGGDADDEL